MALQFSFKSAAIQNVTLDRAVAVEILGLHRAFRLQSWIADMREADFMGEVPGTPLVVLKGLELLLSLDIGDKTALMVQPLGKELIRTSAWDSAHRVMLLNVVRDEEVLV